MIKLLQIAVEINTGSIGRIAEQIGALVIKNGGSSYSAFGRGYRPSNTNVIKIGNKIDVIRHVFETRIFDNHCFSSKKATLNLVKRIESLKPDIIHLHHLHGYFINIEILFKYLSKSNIPVVWTFHDCWSFTGHCTHFDYVDCNKWVTHCFDCPQKNEYPKSLFLDRSSQNFSDKKRIFGSVKNLTVVSVSHWLSSKVNQSFFQHCRKRVIYNGVDVDRFHPKNSRDFINDKYLIKDKFLLLGVATNWDSRKGLQDFIKLNEILSEKYIIVLVGLNDKQLKEIPSSIIGIRRTESQDELCELYSAADLFLNLSVEETFGLTTAEALACGTPCIVYNSTACPEIVDNETGIVVERQNIEELSSAIEQVYSIGKQSYTDSCRFRAISLFDQNERFTDYYNLYLELLNEK